MAIEVTCECGKKLSAPDSAAGKKARCPACGQVVTVPPAGDAPEATGAEPPGAPAPEAEATVTEGKIRFRHSCGRQLRAPLSAAGKKAKCPRCGEVVTIPEPEEETRPEAEPQEPPEPTAQTAPAVAGTPADETYPEAAEAETYPWLPDPELVARAARYDASGQFKRFDCRCKEVLNSALGNELKGLGGILFKKGAKGTVKVYPDMVGVQGRSLWDAVTEKLPDALVAILAFVWNVFIAPILTVLGLVFYAAASALATGPMAIIMLPVQVILAIVVGIVLFFVMLVMRFLERLTLGRMAKKIRRDPKSSYAVKKLHAYAPLVPRYWAPGDVQQVIRIQSRKRKLQPLVLFVQDNPVEGPAGCLGRLGVIVQIGRYLRGKCRIYACRIGGGEDDADAAAEQAAEVLGCPLREARFSWNVLNVK